MKIRIVSSREEINSLEPSEKLIHLAFRPSNTDIFSLVQTCPNVKAIQSPSFIYQDYIQFHQDVP